MKCYLPGNEEERRLMLETIGVESVDELYASLPSELFVDELDLPPGTSELETRKYFQLLAGNNQRFRHVWRGAGAYRHFIPAIVTQVAAKERFVTAYTPYQAELSQGILQSIFEFQTMICELTGMEIANASLYDGASAAAEACRMAESRKRKTIILAGALDPAVVETIRSYDRGGSLNFVLCPAGADGLVDQTELESLGSEDLAAVFFMQVNALGLLEDVPALCDWAHEQGALAICYSLPVTLGLLEAPGNLGADICVGDGQGLGLPLSYGGPYVGFLSCRDALKRSIPGRIVGETTDRHGERCYVLTLQTREQHIRRERATSNICTNQALCALQVTCYLTTVGPQGLRRQAEVSFARAHALAERLNALGYRRTEETPFFLEFRTTLPAGVETTELEAYLARHGHLAGLPLDDGTMLWCATELNDEEALEELSALLESYASGSSVQDSHSEERSRA